MVATNSCHGFLFPVATKLQLSNYSFGALPFFSNACESNSYHPFLADVNMRSKNPGMSFGQIAKNRLAAWPDRPATD